MEKPDYKEIPFEIDTKGITEDGMFTGYGSTFGGKPDSYGDIIAEGAYAATIMKNGAEGFGIHMLWQHDPTNPIGVWKEIAENKKGLKVTGQLTLGVQQADEAYLLMKAGALKGLSIGYQVQEYEYDKDRKIRTLKKIELHEISPVTFPANTRAYITNVKNLEDAKNERDLERALRDAGLSIKTSKIVVRMCKPYLREIKESNNTLSNIFKALKEHNKDLEIQRLLSKIK